MGLLTENLFINLAAILISLTVCLITFVKWKYTYYSKKGIYTAKPTFLLGNAKNVFFDGKALGEFWGDVYKDIKSHDRKHGGAYFLTSPTYVPIDLEIIKSIMQTDFQHFVGHGMYVNEQAEPISAHLFNLTGDKWKQMRTKLTPTFTSGKMKMMFSTLASCAEGLKGLLEEAEIAKTPLDIKDTLQRFTMEIIGSCAFGIETNSMRDPNTEFSKYGKKTVDMSISVLIKNFLQFVVPSDLLVKFNLVMQNPEVVDFFTSLAKETINYREKNNIYRKDFLHLLLQIKNKGKVTDDESIFNDSQVSENNFTLNEVLAQVFVFFVAGFETSSTAMTFALLELAQRPDLQEKARKEIKEVLAKHKGKLTYEAVQDMTYVEQVIEESLRKYPPVHVIPRLCNKAYKVPGTDLVIEEGERVSIAVYGIHRDPEIYPDPETFDPDRFIKENKAKRHPFAWLPFGAGPRVCIGLRFGVMQAKIGLATILKDYEVTLDKKTKTPIEYDAKSFLILSVAGGVWVNLKKIE